MYFAVSKCIMDDILKGVFQSAQPEKIKRQIFKKMKVAASKSMSTSSDEQQKNVVEVCIGYILYGTEFEHYQGVHLLKEFLKNCNENCYSMFTDDFFNSLILGKCCLDLSHMADGNAFENTITIFRRIVLYDLLMEDFKQKKLVKLQTIVEIYIKTEAIRLLYECHDHKSFSFLCSFLLKNEECFPSASRYFALCSVSIHAMSDFFPLNRNSEIDAYLSDITKISHFLRFIWLKEPAILTPSLHEIFSVISKTTSTEPSNALGCLVDYIPSGIIDNAIAQIVDDPTVSEDQMATALRRMIAWVGWPNATQAHLWVISFFQHLERISSFHLLIEVTLKTAKQVFNCIKLPITRVSSFSVFIYMMMSFQSSAEAFHMIVPLIPKVFSGIEKENNPENETYLKQLSNLCQCMMNLHSGFPELYSPILECIKNYPKASEKEISNVLKCTQWKPSASYRVDHLLARCQITGKAGLVNLGNTCYMNSVIQALFMLDGFRSGVLTSTPKPSSITNALYETFSYLLLTERVAYEPKNLLERSRPSWFAAGAQQDCSEYLKYLLDCLHEEERSSGLQADATGSKNAFESGATGSTADAPQTSTSNSPVSVGASLIEEFFHGKVRSCILCSTCSFQSSREETFVDFSLPLNKVEERGGVVEVKSSNKNEVLSLSASTLSTMTRDTATTSSAESRIFIDEVGPEGASRPVQVEDVEEDYEEVPRRTYRLDDLLRDALTEEYLTDDNQYHCAQCGVLRNAVKTTTFTRLPKYFIMSLMRFTYDLKEQRRSKILDNVEIFQEIEIPLYEGNILKPIKYTLSAVIFHSGMSAESGHYYCYAKLRDDRENSWCLFNDSHVSLATFQNLAHLTEQFSRDTAYVLVYSKADIVVDELDYSGLIAREVRDSIEEDNDKFMKEVEEESKRSEVRASRSNVLGWNNDNDPPPPPTCSSGGDVTFQSNSPIC